MIKLKIIACLALSLFVQASQAALLGTTLSIETVYQQTSTSTVDTIGFLDTATVVEPGVEFPSLASTQVINPPSGLQVIDVAINAGDDFLEIDFDNTGAFTSFAAGYFNGYVFTFDSNVAVTFTDAAIDTSVTTLGLSPSDLTFSGNQLLVNVEGLTFNTSTFARINLTSVGGPTTVPLPAAFWLFGSGLLGLIGISRRKKYS